MNGTTRDLRSVLQAIADEDARAATPTPPHAEAELALLTARIRRRRAVHGARTTVGAVAAAGVIGVLVVQGIGVTPDVSPAVDSGPVLTAVPAPEQPAPSPTDAMPTPDPETPTPGTRTPTPETATTEPAPSTPAPLEPSAGAVPAVTQKSDQTPAEREAAARAIFIQYLDSWRRGRLGEMEALTAPSDRPIYTASYTPTDAEPTCQSLQDGMVLQCDVDVLQGSYLMVRVSVEQSEDGQWWVHAAEFGLG